MSWLWKDKKTEQLKSVLHTAFEDDKKSTANRLTKIKNEAKLFKNNVEAAFSDSRLTTSKFHFDSELNGMWTDFWPFLNHPPTLMDSCTM